MTRYAIVQSEDVAFDGATIPGTVITVIESDLTFAEAYAASLDYTEGATDFIHTPWESAEADTGGTYDDTGGYTVPPILTRSPQTVSAYQLKRQLLEMISVTDSVTPVLTLAEDYLNGIANATEKAIKLLQWNCYTTWDRGTPLLLELQAELSADLGGNEADIASLFLESSYW